MAREMKDSKIQWVGEIPEDWAVYRNKVLFSCSKEIVGDKSESTQLLSLTTQGIKKKSQNDVGGKVPGSFDTYQVVEPDDIVMCLFDLDCSAVFSGISHDFGMISPAYKVIKCNQLILPAYADYWFKFVFAGRKYMSYAKNLRFTLNYDEFSAVLTATPPINKQSEIVRFLNAKCHEIDVALDKTRASIEEYKKLKQAIITQAVSKGVRGDRVMKESGIEWVKELPTEWEVIPSKHLFRNSDERKHTTDELLTASQKHGIISQADYMRQENTGIVLATKGIENWKHIEPHNFIISLRSFQGGLEMSEISGCITWHYIVLKPLRPIHSFYYKWLFKSQLYIKALQRTCNFIRDGQDLRYSNFVQVPLLIPPMEEQKEIADHLNDKCAKIDALIQKKEKLLEQLEFYKKSLIYEYVTGKMEVALEQEQHIQEIIVCPHFPATLQAKNPRFAQAVLMSKVLDECRTKMGRVKLEKIMFVLENSIGFDFDTEYVREAAGPLDKSIYTCEGMISRSNKWYIITSSRYGVSYRPAKDQQRYKNYYQKYFGEYDAEIERVIGIFKDYSTDQAEIIATLYGAWNDFIIDKRSYTDNDIVDEVLTNWNDSKKRFSKDVWLRAIQKMRELTLVPHGYGRHTVSKGGKGCG